MSLEKELPFISARRRRDGSLIMPKNIPPGVRTPQFPGVEPGMSIDQVRQVIRNQKRARGFRQALSAGASNSFSIELTGTARVFLGFSITFEDGLAPASLPDSFSITINNEIVILNVFPQFFTQKFMDDEYYFIPRPLSGQDTIVVDWNAPDTSIAHLIVYYI